MTKGDIDFHTKAREYLLDCNSRWPQGHSELRVRSDAWSTQGSRDTTSKSIRKR